MYDLQLNYSVNLDLIEVDFFFVGNLTKQTK